MDTNKYEEVGGEFGQTIRWTKEPKNDWEKENTEYVGDEIEGVLEDVRHEVGKNDATVYEIKSGENLYSVFENTVLGDKMRKVLIGQELKIQYLGEKETKSGGKTYKDFKVFKVPTTKDETSDM